MLSHELAVINTDVGVHSKCLPQISIKEPPLKYKADLSPVFVTTLSDQSTLVD